MRLLANDIPCNFLAYSSLDNSPSFSTVTVPISPPTRENRFTEVRFSLRVGGLIGVVELGVKNGLVNKSAGNKVIAIDNTIIRIKINSLYSCTTFAVSMYDGGEVGLFLLSITLNNNLHSKCGIIGSSRTTKIYTKDTDIYIATDSKSNANYTISSFTPNSGVVSVDAIPRQEFDDSYYEVPISSII